jgi:hypothetical protein
MKALIFMHGDIPKVMYMQYLTNKPELPKD